MANYNVDIAVALKGAEKLGRFNKQIRDVAENIKGANIFLQSFSAGSEGLARSVGNLQRNLSGASSNLRNVALGTKEATIAASQFLEAQNQVNKGLAEQQKLLDDLSGATARKSAADNKNLQEGLLKLETKQTRELEKKFGIQQEFQQEFKDEINKINQQRQKENKLLQKNVQQTKKSVAEEIKKKFSIMASHKTRKAAFQQSVREFELENRINKVLAKRKQLQARKAINQRAVSNAVIGGAFPLLFGQGLGASIGGAAGGFAGGKKGGQFGFAFSLLGTVLGSQLDRLAQSARELGEALRNPIKNMDMLVTKMGQANTPFGDTVETLKSLGLEAVAADQVLNNFNKTFGTNKTQLSQLGEESVRFTNELAKLGTGITLFIAGPLTFFLEKINAALGFQTVDEIRDLSRAQAIKEKRIELGILRPDGSRGPLFAFKQLFEGKIREMPDVKARTFELFEQNMNEAGLGGQAGTRDFSNENLQRIIKERRDFELSSLNKQLEIEQKSLGFRSEDIKVLKQRMDLLKIVEKIKVKELVNTEIMNDEQKRAHEFALDKLEIERQISEELLKQAIIMANPMEAAIVNLNKEMTKFNDLRFQTVEFAKAVGSSFQESFKGIIKGTMSVQDAFRNMFNRIADHFLDMAAQILANRLQRGLIGFIGNSLLGGLGSSSSGVNLDEMSLYSNSTSITPTMASFGGTRANGGSITGGKSYLVGEKGPEMFTPGASGMITPNSALSGATNIVVNVDASGSSVEGDAEQSRELGRLISVAIQSELIKQKRPGGLLT